MLSYRQRTTTVPPRPQQLAYNHYCEDTINIDHLNGRISSWYLAETSVVQDSSDPHWYFRRKRRGTSPLAPKSFHYPFVHPTDLWYLDSEDSYRPTSFAVTIALVLVTGSPSFNIVQLIIIELQLKTWPQVTFDHLSGRILVWNSHTLSTDIWTSASYWYCYQKPRGIFPFNPRPIGCSFGHLTKFCLL